jgi:hypothetical protein
LLDLNTPERITLSSPSAGIKTIDISLHTTIDDDEEETTETVSIPVVPPFEVTSKLSYRSSSKADRVGEASISSFIRAPGGRDLEVESLEVVANVSDCKELRFRKSLKRFRFFPHRLAGLQPLKVRGDVRADYSMG